MKRLLWLIIALIPSLALAEGAADNGKVTQEPSATVILTDDGTLTDKQSDSRNINNLKPYRDDKVFKIGTGTISGTYYPIGNVMCKLVNRDKKSLGLRCVTETSQGSLENLNKIKSAAFDFAIVQSDWQESAYEGVGIFKDKRMEKLRFVMSLHTEAFTIIVRNDAQLKTLKDLLGKVVNIGSEGSGTRATWNELMQVKGWARGAFKGLTEYKLMEQPEALCNGDVDALVISTGHPTEMITDVSRLCEVKILELKDDDINRLVASNPEFSVAMIPGGIYAGIPNAIETFGVKATLLASTDVSDEIVYKVTKQIFTNLSTLRAANPMLSSLEVKKMITEGRTAPFHPGAIRYYREMGWVAEQ